MTLVPPPLAVMTRELPRESRMVLLKDMKKKLRCVRGFFLFFFSTKRWRSWVVNKMKKEE